MNGAYMLPAIGEIGRRAPDLVAPFVGPMTGYLWDDGLRPGILDALCRIADEAPELIEDIRDRLLALEEIDDDRGAGVPRPPARREQGGCGWRMKANATAWSVAGKRSRNILIALRRITTLASPTPFQARSSSPKKPI